MPKFTKGILVIANILLFAAITFFAIALFGKQVDGEAYIGTFDTMDFNDDWVLNEGRQEITLPVVLPQQTGKTISIENTLPPYIEEGMRLCMRTALQEVYFYIDGELRGSYASEQMPHVSNYLPSSYVMLDLTKEDAGKDICIQIVVKGTGKLNGITIGYGNNAWFAVLKNNIPVVVAAFILVAAGILAILLYLVMRHILDGGRAVWFLGQAMIVIGLWIISESNLRQLLFKSPSYSVFFSYMLIELIAGFVALYFDEIQQHKYDRAYAIIEILVFGQAAVNTILALTGIVEFYTTLPLSHIWMVIGVVIFIVTVLVDIKNEQIKNYSITALGMLLFVLCCIFEIVGFYVRDFYIIGKYVCVGLIVLLITTIVQIITDEIDKIKLNAELARAKEAAENANLAKTQFLNRMSHEIRTPINAIMGMNEMILRESDDTQIREYAGSVKDSAAILLGIVNEVLDSSKIEAGMMEIVPVNYEMGSLLNDLYNMTNIKAKEKQLQLFFDISPDIPRAYYGDDKHIRQILLNLLSNAVKYTNEGTVTLTLRCRLEDEKAVLCYAVKDTGIGIRQEDLDKIYDAFSRFELSRNRNVEGSGLGMKIVRQLLHLMDSELLIKSEYGKGSEFSFEIVQQIVNKEPLGEFREKGSRVSGDGVYHSLYIAPQAKVLIVDDYEMNRKVFKNLLKDTKIKIYEANGGRECMELLKQQSFDMIFLDHMMPEMDGIEVLKVLRENKICDGVPIIALTANAIVGAKERYLDAGFDDFLSKPIEPEKLDNMILKYLSNAIWTDTEAQSENTQSDIADSIMHVDEEKMDDVEMKVKKENILAELGERLPELNFDKAMTICSGDVDFYMELLEDFSELSIREELTKYWRKADYKNYCIRIHGFKNNAFSIGAESLGNLAYEMERLVEKGELSEVEKMQSDLLSQYDRICAQYREVIPL